MNSKWLPMLLAILAYAVYHSAQKYLSPTLNPLLVTAIAYTCAMAIAWTLFVFIPMEGYLSVSRSTLIPILLIGLSVVGLDIGFILAYRMGWGVSLAPIVANASVALLLLPVGLFFFKESLNTYTLAGFILCLLGLVCIKLG